MASKDSLNPQISVGSALSAMPPHTIEELFPTMGDTCEVQVSCHPSDYSASRIAHAVEDCDAHLLNLNVTSGFTNGGEVVVALRIGLRNPDRVVRSLERYGYNVISTSGIGDDDDDTMRDRINELLRLINT